MANHKSALKRHRQSEKRRERNASVKSAIRTAVKKVRTSIDAANAEEAKTNLLEATRVLDGAVTKGVLHRNNASRRVSRLTTAVNSIESK